MEPIPISARSRTLADYTCEGLILPNLHGRDAASVIHELTTALHREGRVPDLLPFYQAALNGEYLAAAVASSGWALPHARVASLEQPWFAAGRCPFPITWAGQARSPVKMVFLFCVPETDTRGYLGTLSALARLSCTPRLAERLACARTAGEFLDVFRQAVVLEASQPCAVPQLPGRV